ncbi:hypothetical protein FRC12_019762 [Ceratobasidium sp. 428]|nr:hypothetical protein FRC12_019762 [Ceratobasidium sp. 428]
MVLSRIVGNFDLGMLLTIVLIYQSEVSPAEHRETLACIEFTGNLLDTRRLWVYYFWSFLESNMSWRLPLFIQWAIGSILAGGSLLLPESPRRLVDTDKLDKGQRVIRDGVLNDIPTEPEFNEIKDMVQKDRLVGGRSCLSMWRRYKQRVLVVISSQAFAQLVRAIAFGLCALPTPRF